MLNIIKSKLPEGLLEHIVKSEREAGKNWDLDNFRQKMAEYISLQVDVDRCFNLHRSIDPVAPEIIEESSESEEAGEESSEIGEESEDESSEINPESDEDDNNSDNDKDNDQNRSNKKHWRLSTHSLLNIVLFVIVYSLPHTELKQQQCRLMRQQMILLMASTSSQDVCYAMPCAPAHSGGLNMEPILDACHAVPNAPVRPGGLNMESSCDLRRPKFKKKDDYEPLTDEEEDNCCRSRRSSPLLGSSKRQPTWKGGKVGIHETRSPVRRTAPPAANLMNQFGRCSYPLRQLASTFESQPAHAMMAANLNDANAEIKAIMLCDGTSKAEGVVYPFRPPGLCWECPTT
jgi:hypothetical protein